MTTCDNNNHRFDDSNIILASLYCLDTILTFENYDTVIVPFLDAKEGFDRVNHWTPAKKLLDRNAPLHIVKLFIFWYREQEFIVRWDNALSLTFHCANGIRQEGQLSPLLHKVYTDVLNHHIRATGVGCYVGGAWINSLTYADDMVLLAPTLSSSDALGGMSRICWSS